MKKWTDLATVCLFLSLLCGLALAFWIIPDASFSEQEKRALQTTPILRTSTLFSGEYATEVNDYFADQFPMRDLFVGCKGWFEFLQGKGGNNGILVGKNQQMARRLFDMRRADPSVSAETDVADPAVLQSAADALLRVEQSLEIPFTAMITPRPIDVAADAFSYPADQSKALFDRFYDLTAKLSSNVRLLPSLENRYRNGEYVYYRTDHHWTVRGAYYAYEALLCEWGMADAILPIEDFEKEVASTDFYGSLWAAGGMKWIEPDQLELWYYGNEDLFEVCADGHLVDGFYDRTRLATKDQYSVYLYGTHDVVTVTKKGEVDRPTLVLFKDSFANSLAPFLAQHFDLVLLNLSSTRRDFTDVCTYARQYGADRVLLIYTMENLITADRLGSVH